MLHYVSVIKALVVKNKKKGKVFSMKFNTMKRVPAVAILLLLVLSLLFVGSDFGQVAVQASEYIREITGNINTNIEQYFDGSVLYQLPDTIEADQDISVVVKLANTSIIDAYNKTDKTLSVGEYAVTEAADEIRANIAAEKQAILKTLDEKQINYRTGADYDTVLSGFEIIIKAADFTDVTDSLDDDITFIVSEEYQVADSQLVENEVNFDEATGIFDSTDFAYDGSGMLIAVLDTGLDYTHTAFSMDNFTASSLAITKNEVAKLLGDTRAYEFVEGLHVDDVYVSDKVPFSFDYADGDSDVYSLHNNHGTHVSGVIVGHDDTIRGVAPNAQLVSMKIFSDVRESAFSSWILAALEDCVTLGVDVINMSLGTSCGFSREIDKQEMEQVYDDIRDLGISMVVAASNSFSSAQGSEKNGNLPLTSNPDTATVGSPSTYDSAMSVASINGVKTPYILFNDQIIYFDEATNAASDERNFFEDILEDGENEREIEYVTIPGAGREADYSGIDVVGKIALVERGFTTFEEKADVAQKKGAAGIIIYNNVSGDIKMNVGISTVPVCSISQTDGQAMAAQKTGTIKISRSQTSGPFMSDFSSWGPTPDLGIKPEITAHGGNILSAVTGGDYDRLSGTSMACPNMAGVTALLKQYVHDNFPDLNAVEVNAVINRLLMSTADIVYNTNGLPYAVRKQGSGLANLNAASTTTAYILTYDRYNGSIMDKSKIELGDDADKTGVYTLRFAIDNFGSTSLTYKLSAFAMTEGVSETKTSHGETTVTTEGYMLNGTTVEFTVSGGTKDGDTITVEAGKTAEVVVTLTLSDADKAYMDESFENGMYVEGFVELEAVSGTEIDLSVPYLAFYGDWTVSPLFDVDYFETHADELAAENNPNMELADKTLADSYATRPIGGVSEDYVSYLGAYYFVQDPASTKIISAERDYIALSNTEGTVHSLRFVWAGMLRNAKRIEITITDDATGEVIFETVDDGVRKSYGDGGTIRPSNVKIEFDISEHNLKNNTEYTVRLVGYLDNGTDENDDGCGQETNLNNVFEFPFVTDFEAPALTDCTFRAEYDKDLKKNRLFAEMAVYDNHYTMAMMIGYVTQGAEGALEVKPFEDYLTPVYSVRDGVTYVEFELTDYIQDIKEKAVNKNSFVVSCYDYALNEATYEIVLPDEYRDFYFEETNVTLSPNQLYNLTPLMYPDTAWGELLNYNSTNPEVAKVVNGKIVAGKSGVAQIYTEEKDLNGKNVTINVKVLAEGEEGYQVYDKPVADIFKIVGYDTLKAYYIMDTSERELGETDDYRVLETSSLAFYPSESIQLHYRLDAYFPSDTQVVFESSNENIVTIDQNGIIVAQKEGFASVTVKVLMDGAETYYSSSISIEVKNPFVTAAPGLSHYYGLGGIVEIPERLLLTRIDQYAFSNYHYISKTEDDVISEDEPEYTKIAYIGDDTITKVIIPEGVESIGPYAFANLTALEEVVLPSTLESIEYGAFFGCKSLKKVTGIEHVKLINKDAFNGCNITGTLSLDNARAVGDYAFAGNTALKEVILPETLQSIGAYTFYGNTSLTKVTVKADKVKYGPYVFAECTSLTEIAMNAIVIPEGAFYGDKLLEKVTIGKDVSTIGPAAFYNTAIKTFTVDGGNTAYQVSADKSYLTSKDGKTLLLVAPRAGENLTFSANITTVGKGAFASANRLQSVNLPGVTVIEDYAFYGCDRLDTVSFGQLTHIGDYAFYDTDLAAHPDFGSLTYLGKYSFAYSSMTSVTIPAGLVVGEGAFCECPTIATVTVGDGANLGLGAFMLSRDNNYKLVCETLASGKKQYSFEYLSALTSLTIGDNVTIGESAFMGAAKLVGVTLGEGVSIGDRAFYSCASLTDIDLSKVISIGLAAFSGDELYVFVDENQNSYARDDEGNLIYKYYAPKLTSVDLSALTSLGEQAFLYCKQLTTVHLGEGITFIPKMAFYGCDSLCNIDLSRMTSIGSNAFVETALESVDLSSATFIDTYAFVYCEDLVSVVFNPNGTEIGEGAFSYCAQLTDVKNLQKVTSIDAYAFAYAGLTKVDLTAAISIGDHAFLKETATAFEVTLGNALTYLGDNPFAFCIVAPFSTVSDENIIVFNGKEYATPTFTYEISDCVRVIDGSLYCDVPYGMELITYCGTDDRSATVAQNTVRITAYAFAASKVQRVELPYTLASIGHKAFYDCQALSIVAFTSYEAPNLEEEFDPTYYESYENLPATGDYEFQLWNGQNITHSGLGIVPFYMWNLSDGKYSNVYYGANFIDYVGKNDAYVTMIRPVNGQYYDTFIFDKYFSLTYDGAAAADDITLAAIAAIDKIVEIIESGQNISLKHEAIVVAAREAYDKIATREQQALVTNYNFLTDAEKRIAALKADTTPEPDPEPTDPENNIFGQVLAVLAVAVFAGVILLLACLLNKKKKGASVNAASETAPAVEPIVEAEVVSDEVSQETAADEAAPEASAEDTAEHVADENSDAE